MTGLVLAVPGHRATMFWMLAAAMKTAAGEFGESGFDLWSEPLFGQFARDIVADPVVLGGAHGMRFLSDGADVLERAAGGEIGGRSVGGSGYRAGSWNQ